MTNTNQAIIVAKDSCGEELDQFVSWMSENYPNVEVEVKNALHSSDDCQKYWDEYCNS